MLFRSNYSKLIKNSQVADVLPKFDALFDLYKYQYNSKEATDDDRWIVAMNIADVRKAIAERKFTGLRKWDSLTAEEKEDVKKETLVKFEYDELTAMHPNEEAGEINLNTVKEPKDNIIIVRNLINLGLITGTDILAALEGLCMQLGIIWNDKDIVNTVDTSKIGRAHV
mgnify:CR=1 FL=1